MAAPIYYNRTYRTVVDDPKLRALDELIGQARQQGDAGASEETINRLLNEVDMGRAGRVGAGWASRNATMDGAAGTMLSGTAAALEALRLQQLADAEAARAQGGGRGRGGGGGSRPLPPFIPTEQADPYDLADIERYIYNAAYGGPESAVDPIGGYKPTKPTKPPLFKSGWNATKAVGSPKPPKATRVNGGEAPRPARGGNY